jgi:hypothetical protein
MKTIRSSLILLPSILLAFSLSGCTTTAAAEGTDVFAEIYTSVALTVTANTVPVTPTASLVDTPTKSPTPLPAWSATATPAMGASSSSYSYASGCNDAGYVSDVTIPDGSVLAPGETFTKTWELLNTGSCTWRKVYTITFVGGDDMDGSGTDIDQSVDPGEQADVSVSLTAPDDEGTYTGYWRLSNSEGTVFGERVFVQIVVSEDADVNTATSTPTDISSTATSTPVPVIATPYPTYTPTEIPTMTAVDTPTIASTSTMESLATGTSDS